jgi:hypothetical protein
MGFNDRSSVRKNLQEVQNGIDGWRSTGAMLLVSYCLAEALYLASRISEALEAIREAQALVELPVSLRLIRCSNSARCGQSLAASSASWTRRRSALDVLVSSGLVVSSGANTGAGAGVGMIVGVEVGVGDAVAANVGCVVGLGVGVSVVSGVGVGAGFTDRLQVNVRKAINRRVNARCHLSRFGLIVKIRRAYRVCRTTCRSPFLFDSLRLIQGDRRHARQNLISKSNPNNTAIAQIEKSRSLTNRILRLHVHEIFSARRSGPQESA